MNTKTLISIDQMPGTYNTRIFVAGNYSFQFAFLLEIVEYIHGYSKGYFTPIFAEDYYMEGDIRNSCLRLLHNCKFAIFELTNYAGQLIELEAAKDYGTTFIGVQNSPNSTSVYIPGISMTNIKNQIYVYRSLYELKIIVNEYLAQWKSSSRKNH